MKFRLTSLLLVFSMLALSVCLACSSPAVTTGANLLPSSPGSPPTIQIMKPADNEVLKGDVQVIVDFSNFDVLGEPDQTSANIKGAGQITFCILPVTPVSQSSEQGSSVPSFQISGGGTCELTSADYNISQSLGPGDYQIKAELVNYDNTSLKPPAVDSVNITLGPGKHQITLSVVKK
jgi:hypothetical protein